MAQKYKVFINDLPVFFQESVNDLEIDLSAQLINPNNRHDVERFIDINQAKFPALYIVGKNVFDLYFSDHKLIEAAGGVVKNPADELLFILRLGKWDLPKGKIEKGEKIKEAALREVEEECGGGGLKIIK